MALETCFQVSTIAAASTNSRSTRVVYAHLYNNKERVNSFTTCRSRRMPAALSLPVKSRRLSHVVCQANTVDQVLEVNEASWQSVVIGCEKPVLVEFWAPWCGPCRMLAPVIDELAKDYAGKIVCCKMNTDESPTIAAKFGIRSIPTVLMFKDGEKKESIIGAVAKDALTTTIDKYLAS